MQLTEQEVKLIVASLTMMQRLVRDDTAMSSGERAEINKVAYAIRNKFNSAIFCAGRTNILTPDGALNPGGEHIDGRDIFRQKN